MILEQRREAEGSGTMIRRSPWMIVGLGALAIVGVLGIGLWSYWRSANELPPYSPPRVAMPVPNAYYDYRLAGTMSQAVGAATVQTQPAGGTRPPHTSVAAHAASGPDRPLPPGPTAGPRQGFEEG